LKGHLRSARLGAEIAPHYLLNYYKINTIEPRLIDDDYTGVSTSMSKSRSVRRNIMFIAIIILVVIADQLTKQWIRTHIAVGESIPESGFFRLTHGQNTGAVFGIFQGNNIILTMLVIIEAILILAAYFLVRSRYRFLDTRLNILSLGLIMGGLLGNLIDRIHLGAVTDFISIGPWPDFNLADSSGVVGVILLSISFLLFSRKVGPRDQH
jgi:signal peptidase II